MAANTPARPRKAGGDFTGQQQAKNAEEKKLELKEAAERMSVITAVEAEVRDTIIDMTDPTNPVPEVQVRQVEVSSPVRVIVTNQDMDNVTWGREVYDPGNIEEGRPAVMGPLKMFSFKEGQRYKIQADLANHLNDKGYLAFLGNA